MARVVLYTVSTRCYRIADALRTEATLSCHNKEFVNRVLLNVDRRNARRTKSAGDEKKHSEQRLDTHFIFCKIISTIMYCCRLLSSHFTVEKADTNEDFHASGAWPVSSGRCSC